MMLYIHKLGNFIPKLVELETVHLVRELRERVPYPLTVEKVQDYFLEFFVSDTDKETLEQGKILIPICLETLQKIGQERDPLHEAINIQRTIQILSEMPEALERNGQYLQEVAGWQNTFFDEALSVFNALPRLRATEEKLVYNEKLNLMFGRVLRNTDFSFKYRDIINEAHLAHIVGLSEGMSKGFLFHITLEEELKKLPYEAIRKRAPPEKVQEIEQLREYVEFIRRAVERAYQINMRMVNWAVVMYAYVKWLKEK